MKIFLVMWNLGFTVFDIIMAVKYYDITWRFWLFVIAAIIMFVCFILSIIELAKE